MADAIPLTSGIYAQMAITEPSDEEPSDDEPVQRTGVYWQMCFSEPAVQEQGASRRPGTHVLR